MSDQSPTIVSREFFDRRHPEYARMLPEWQFYDATYRGGASWFALNIFAYYKEGQEEYKKRIQRAYRFNHSREVVDLLQKYLFKGEIKRNQDVAHEVLKNFWFNCTRQGLNINQFARIASTRASIVGRVAVVVDNNVRVTEVKNLSIKDEKEGNFRTYAYVVMPWDVLDYAWDEDGDGKLLWIKLREVTRDDADPLNSTGLYSERVRLWTRSEWMLYEEQDMTPTTPGGKANVKIKAKSGSENSAPKEQEKQIVLIEQGSHDLGFVPVKLFDHILGGEPYLSQGMLDDVAYLDRAVANYLSNLDAIIQDQTFSQLAIPAAALNRGDDLYTTILEMGTKRVFTYDGGAGSTAKPEFLSPDPKQAGVILQVINKIINEIYSIAGLAGERTKEDNSVGIDNSSGVAKAYDFERVNSLLLAKAQSCQDLENWIADTVLAWNGMEPTVEDVVTYPTTFDIARLGDEITIAESLAKINAPIELRREQMNLIVDKLFPQISQDLRSTLRAAVQSWDFAVLEKPGTEPSPTVTGSRQGQVTNSKTKEAAE